MENIFFDFEGKYVDFICKCYFFWEEFGRNFEEYFFWLGVLGVLEFDRYLIIIFNINIDKVFEWCGCKVIIV